MAGEVTTLTMTFTHKRRGGSLGCPGREGKVSCLNIAKCVVVSRVVLEPVFVTLYACADPRVALGFCCLLLVLHIGALLVDVHSCESAPVGPKPEQYVYGGSLKARNRSRCGGVARALVSHAQKRRRSVKHTFLLMLNVLLIETQALDPLGYTRGSAQAQMNSCAAVNISHHTEKHIQPRRCEESNDIRCMDKRAN